MVDRFTALRQFRHDLHSNREQFDLKYEVRLLSTSQPAERDFRARVRRDDNETWTFSVRAATEGSGWLIKIHLRPFHVSLYLSSRPLRNGTHRSLCLDVLSTYFGAARRDRDQRYAFASFNEREFVAKTAPVIIQLR